MLGVSQALLSHYEKGIRECGLDFVIRAADLYEVSTDYMLGRTSVKSIADESCSVSSLYTTEEEMLYSEVKSSFNILFTILKKINSKSLTKKTAAYIMQSVSMVLDLFTEENEVKKSMTLLSENIAEYSGIAAKIDENPEIRKAAVKAIKK